MTTWLAALDAISNTAKTVVGIGGLIFVHELGHFLVGRACNVKAEAFSIGFGPVLWKWQPGETEYRLSAIPLGGYVKFLGENPDERGDLDPRSFHAATYPRKVAIMLAGVTMNAIVAFALFAAAFSVGVEVPAPVVGSVRAGSPAEEAGLRPGDRIVSIDGHRILDFMEIFQETSVRDEVTVVIERGGSVLAPQRIPTRDDGLGVRALGIGPSRRTDGTIALSPDSPAEKAGFLPGDRVVAVDGAPVADVAAAVERHAAAAGPTRWKVERAGGAVELTVPRHTAWRLGIQSHAPAVAGEGVGVAPGGDESEPGPARDAGIAAGSRITAVDGKPVSVFEEIRPLVAAAGEAGRPLVVTWVPPEGGDRREASLRPVQSPDPYLTSFGIEAAVLTEVVRETSLGAACALGIERTHRWVMRIFGALGSLVTGRVSPKHMQGPIKIARETYGSAEEGFSKLALFLGIISMNLAVLNVLPIPLLDGGQLAIATAERIRGRALPERLLIGIQWSGLLLLLAFMVFVVMNDLRNM